MQRSLVLLSTAHCSLCDEALDALFGMSSVAGAGLTVLDIAGDAALIESHGERLPVLQVRLGAQVLGELDWPFDEPAVAALLQLPSD